MNNTDICIILNQYQYRDRTNWRLTIPVHACESNDITTPTNVPIEFISYPAEQYDKQRYLLDEFGAIAICEKLVKQSSDDDIKAIVLSIIKPYKKRIEELEQEIEFYKNKTVLSYATHKDLEEEDTD